MSEGKRGEEAAPPHNRTQPGPGPRCPCLVSPVHSATPMPPAVCRVGHFTSSQGMECDGHSRASPTSWPLRARGGPPRPSDTVMGTCPSHACTLTLFWLHRLQCGCGKLGFAGTGQEDGHAAVRERCPSGSSPAPSNTVVCAQVAAARGAAGQRREDTRAHHCAPNRNKPTAHLRVLGKLSLCARKEPGPHGAPPAPRAPSAPSAPAPASAGSGEGMELTPHAGVPASVCPDVSSGLGCPRLGGVRGLRAPCGSERGHRKRP